MTDPSTISIGALTISFVLGLVLSGLYFGTLWLSLRRLVNCQRPELFLLLSLLFRMVFLLSSFYLILHVAHWQHLLAALAGFMFLRILLTRKIRTIKTAQSLPADTEITS